MMIAQITDLHVRPRGKVAYERVGPEGEEALTADLHAYLEEYNTAGEGTLVLEPEYLQVVATRA